MRIKTLARLPHESILFLATFGILLTFGTVHPASASTPISTTISGNETWTKVNSPYVVDSVYIPSGTSLTIEPGVIVEGH